jgi:hypothetical protein
MAKKRWSTKADECPEFVEFWQLWLPRARDTDGRGDARDTFLEHVSDHGADPQDILDGAKWFLRSFTEWKYLPLAATWINRRAYEDFAERERAYHARIAELKAKAAQPVVQSENVVPISPERRAEMAARARAMLGGTKLQEA